MIGQLVLTEIRINRLIIALSLIANLAFASHSLIQGTDLLSFAAASTLVFYILVLAWSVASGEEKRGRMFAELPVTKTQCFAAGWLFVLFLLLIHVAFWVLVALLSAQTNIEHYPSALLSGFLGIGLILATIGIWVDLWAHRPYYYHWVYFTAVILIASAATHQGVLKPFMERSDSQAFDGFNVYPVLFWPMTAQGTLLLGFVVVALLVADYFVFTRSDNFLS